MLTLLQSHNTWLALASPKPLSCWALARGLAHSVQLLSRGAGLHCIHKVGGPGFTGTCTNKGEPDAKETLRDASGGSSGCAGGCARAIDRAGLRHDPPVVRAIAIQQRPGGGGW